MPSARAPLVATLLLAGITACAAVPDARAATPAAPDSLTRAGAVWLGLPAFVNTEAEIAEEFGIKLDLVRDFLDEWRLDGLLLARARNIRWLTAGTVGLRAAGDEAMGLAALLVLRDGRRFALRCGRGTARLAEESSRLLGFEAVERPWHDGTPASEDCAELLRAVAGERAIGADATVPGTTLVAEQLAPLRQVLTESEWTRYRWLGHEAAEAAQTVCRRLRPGMDDRAIEAMAATELRARGLLPSAVLVGVDERIAPHGDFLPTGAVLGRLAMVGVVAEKWGMAVAATRLVHFGPPAPELQAQLVAAAVVSARFQAATVPGADCAKIFEAMKAWYAEAGFPEEWQRSAQGGAVGYGGREYLLHSGIAQVVQVGQPFAWNPAVGGARVEDTLIAWEDGVEIVTDAGNWPVVRVTLGGIAYPQPAILVMDGAGGQELIAQELSWP